MTRPMGEMSDELFHKIIKDGKEIGAKFYVPFLNGEPFVFGRIWEWLDYMEQEGVKFAIYTNAEFMDVDRLVKYKKLYYVNCSFNSTTEDVYKKVMPGPDFNRCKHNIEDLISRNRVHVQVSFVVSDENKHQIEDFKKMWGRRAKIRDFKNYTGARHAGVEKKGTKKPCYALFNTIVILWDGRVVPCCMDYDGKLILGDVNKDTIANIYQNTQWLRDKHTQLDFNIKPCDVCNYNETT
jgi:radical SAM protein with 4Fe4S-binding SPASM domain